jgi:2-amino-4-hydroxy-6-hydroxymethyldihydropteridine diphosphokinase
MTTVALCLGSNLGDRQNYLSQMELELQDILNGSIIKSRIMETEPVDVNRPQEWYLNRIIKADYKGSPSDLLTQTQLIEKRLGRIDKNNRLPRTSDIDILLFGNMIIKTDVLSIPHPAILSRRFCLEGLFEIMPEHRVGIDNDTVRDLYSSMSAEMRAQKVVFG